LAPGCLLWDLFSPAIVAYERFFVPSDMVTGRYLMGCSGWLIIGGGWSRVKERCNGERFDAKQSEIDASKPLDTRRNFYEVDDRVTTSMDKKG
jgi:hypothetical protein